MSRNRSNSTLSSLDSEGSVLRDHVDAMDRQRNGNDDAYSYTNSPPPIPVPMPVGPVPGPSAYRGAMEKHQTNSRSRSGRRSRDHSRTATRDLVRLLVAEEMESKEAMRVLSKTADRLELESRRANDAEQRLREAQERWRMVNQARLAAQQEAAKATEELRLYKLQLESAQAQIARANDMIAISDKEKAVAEDAAERARATARKYQEERLVQRAKEEGRRMGREEGRREGREVGYGEAVEEAYSRARQEAREEAMRQLDVYLTRQGLPPREAYDDDDEPLEYDDNQGQPNNFDDDILTGPDELNASNRRVAPTPVARGTGAAPPPRRSNTITRTFNRLRGRTRDQTSRDVNPNVEVNENVPDAAPISDTLPRQNVTTPLPASSTSQTLQAAMPTGAMHMPEPDFHPNPRDVHPISVRTVSPTPSHPQFDIPPDGWIPTADPDGSIGIPPPHELAIPPPSPRTTSSPLPINAQMAPMQQGPVIPPVPPPKELKVRDFASQNDSSLPRMQRHRHTRSIPDSLASASTATAQFELVSNPISRADRGLSAIPEQATPAGSARRMSMLPEGNIPFPVAGSSRDGGSMRGQPQNSNVNGGYTNDPDFASNAYSDSPRRARARSQKIADELRFSDPALRETRRRQEESVLSPRSARSGLSSGPRRPSHVTMPTPLAPPAALVPELEQPAYIRPRVNSTGSDTMGNPNRGVPQAIRVVNQAYRRDPSPDLSVPDINIEPPSSPASHAARRTPASRGNMLSPDMANIPMPATERPSSRGDLDRTASPVIPPLSSHVRMAATSHELPTGFVPNWAESPAVGISAPSPIDETPAGFMPMSIVPDTGPPLNSSNSPGTPATHLSGVQLPNRSQGAASPWGNMSGNNGRTTPTPRMVPNRQEMSSQNEPSEWGYLGNSNGRMTPPPNSKPSGQGWGTQPFGFGVSGGSHSPDSSGANAFGTRPVSPRPQRHSTYNGPAVPFPSTDAAGPLYSGTRNSTYGMSQGDRVSPRFGTRPELGLNVPGPVSPRPQHRSSLDGLPDPALIPIPGTSGPSTSGLPRMSMYSPSEARTSTSHSRPTNGPPNSISPRGSRSNIREGPIPPDRYGASNFRHPEDIPIPSTIGTSVHTLTTTPGRNYETAPLPRGVHYPAPPASPALSATSTVARGLRVPLPSSGGGDSPRSTKFYPRTPFQRQQMGFDNDDDGPPPLDRPMNDFTDRNPELRRSDSRVSLSSNRSHKHYDPSTYRDAAFLASEHSMFLPNGNEGASGSRLSGIFS